MLAREAGTYALSPAERHIASGTYPPREKDRRPSWRCLGCGNRFAKQQGYAAHLLADADCVAACCDYVECGSERIITRSAWIEKRESGKSGPSWHIVFGVSPIGVAVECGRFRDVAEARKMVKEARCQQQSG